jgi:hypothetical protein
MISFKHSGSFNKTDKFFKRVLFSDYLHIFNKYGVIGVNALSSVTPLDTGKTANSWGYKIQRSNKGVSITWTNSNIVDGIPVVILLLYGHVGKNGGYIQGLDFINPIMKPIFNKIIDDIWKEVTLL